MDTSIWQLEELGLRFIGRAVNDLTQPELRALAYSASRLPRRVLEVIWEADSQVDIVQGAGITVDPAYAYLRGVRAGAGWDTWDTLPGAGGQPGYPVVVVGNLVGRQFHGCADLLLHETAHAFDLCYPDGPLHKRTDWQNLHRHLDWCDSYYRSPAEALAEATARYWLGGVWREELLPGVRGYLEGRS